MKEGKGQSSPGSYGLTDESDTSESDSMTTEEIDFLKRSFDLYDLEKNGLISIAETVEILEALTGNFFTENDVRDLLKSIGVATFVNSAPLKHGDNDVNKVQIQEFLNIMNNLGYSMDGSRNNIKRAFRLIDNENKGYITVGDIKKKRDALGINECDYTNEDLEMMMQVLQSNLADDTTCLNGISFNSFVEITR